VLPTSKQSDPDYVRAAGQHMRKCFDQIYGGQRITVVESPRPAADDGLRAAAAREKDHANILAGPDTPGRRWLQRHLSRASNSARQPSRLEIDMKRPI
jgi:hypothetical protein